MRRVALALTAILLLAGCNQREGDAIVVSKEYIAAAPSPKPNEASPEAEAADESPRELRVGEITVDGFVMTPEVRGTGRDPRATADEQWRVTVQTVADGRTLVVHAEQGQFAKLKQGDRVRVRYRTGKHTGTVWNSEIVR